MKNHPNNTIGTCKKCHGKMKRSVALENQVDGIPDFPGGDVVTVSYGKRAKLILCHKCTNCGWSIYP